MNDKTSISRPSLGFIVDKNDHIIAPAMLSENKNHAELSILYNNNLTEENTVRRWFLEEEAEYFVNDKEILPEPLPKTIRFISGTGYYLLLGCRVFGFSENSSVGTGNVLPDRIVVGDVENDYETIEGLTTTVNGLFKWSGLNSATMRIPFEKDHSDTMTIALKRQDDVEIVGSEGLFFTYRSGTSNMDANGGLTIWQNVAIKTVMPESTWNEQIGVHQTIAMLIGIASWREELFTDMKVLAPPQENHLAPILGIEAPKMMPRRWLDVISNYPSVVRSSDRENGSDHCLYYYDDLGPQGIQRWLYLRKHCEQGMSTLYYLAREENKLALETQATTVGTMLECIGWFITCEKKQTPRMRALKNGCKRPASFDDMLDALLEEFIVDQGVVEHNKDGKRTLPKLAIPI